MLITISLSTTATVSRQSTTQVAVQPSCSSSHAVPRSHQANLMERSSLLRSLHMHQSTVISDDWQNAPPPQIRQIHKYDKYGNITQNVVVVECITVRWLVPNETAWWQRHMCVNNLPKVAIWKCKAIQWQHHQLSAITAAHPSACSVRSCWQCVKSFAYTRAHISCCKAPLLSFHWSHRTILRVTSDWVAGTSGML